MIVRIKGGMGNQLFQYAFLKILETKYGVADIKADFSYFTRGFGFFEDRLSKLDVSLTKATPEDMKKVCLFRHDQQIYTLRYRVPVFLEKMLNRRYFFEKSRVYINPESLLKYDCLDGYWQCWQYPEGVKDILKKEFNILYRCSEKTQRMAKIMSKGNSVLLGVRKGDYLNNSRFYSVLPDYYEKATKYISERIEDPIFYVFSNDMKWVHDNLNLKGLNVVYREKEDQVSDFEELQLMQVCKHAVIPNSTFHWFGAFLQQNENKIIVRPPLYFGDGTPSDVYNPEWVTV